MPETDATPALFSPEQEQGFRDAIAGFGALVGEVRAAYAAIGAIFIDATPRP